MEEIAEKYQGETHYAVVFDGETYTTYSNRNPGILDIALFGAKTRIIARFPGLNEEGAARLSGRVLRMNGQIERKGKTLLELEGLLE